jgi:hypothetical protein
MQSLVPLVQIEFIIGAICGLVFLFWQVRGYHRHRRDFFATLAISTIFAMVSSLMTAIPYFVRVSDDQAITLFWLSAPLAVLATLLATWGSVQLFRAFDEKFRS